MQRMLCSLALGVALFGAPSVVLGKHPAALPTPARMTDGASSIDALLDQFLVALAARDEQGLHRLRVNETEYRGIIIPGTVKVGEPPRQVDSTPSEFFWRMLNQKSEDVGRAIMQQFGGHQYTRTNVTYTKGTREFAWYKAIGEVRLHVKDETGAERLVSTGSIAEVNGRYKFIGFNFNN